MLNCPNCKNVHFKVKFDADGVPFLECICGTVASLQRSDWTQWDWHAPAKTGGVKWDFEYRAVGSEPAE